ncbi:MAG: hypothetical protein COS99_05915 [Candidatus Omnitrophica bacterium CG07_land_8_20_14_0_80_42_15]|uniref:SGNH hydrolase-type esterase domain-containing protein n=1 Tax=Candidatus Aquitaenariimonas noxiae TaxID=1974741 RepID=A0A2J0KSM2_9BACT|nr:MAG: hypothetical protein COS99_05915 [Candidatus Omnitrophica bacterium CG07_land_8_20_14_0_80_42_15]
MSKKLSFTVLSLILSVIIFLAAGEIIIRIEASIEGGHIWTPDPYLHTQHIPNTYFASKGRENEFIGHGYINKWGFIGKPCNIGKNQGTLRIITVGDSFTEAVQVDMGKNYSSRLEQLFKERGENVEVINAGMSGYSPKLEYLYIRDRLLKFKPDYIIVQLFANDVYDDHYQYKNIKDNVNPPFGRSFIYQHSRFYHYFSRQKVKLAKKISKKEKFPVDQFFFIREGNDELKKEAWRDTEDYLSRIKEIADSNKIKLIVFIAPLEFQVKGVENINNPFYFDKKPTDDFDNAAREFCKAHDIDFIDMLKILKDNKNQALYYPLDGHLNENGHKLVAETIFEFMEGK